jgi:thiol-disulfide isomerase/thioredoxin
MPKLKWLFIISFITSCNTKDIKPFKTGLEGKPLPEFTLLLPDSSTHFNSTSLSTDKKTLIFYFKPTCPYCRLETKRIIKNIDKLKNWQLCMVTSANANQIQRFYKEFNINKYENIKMGLDSGGKLSKYLRPFKVPYLAVVGKDRNIIHVLIGTASISQLIRI